MRARATRRSGWCGLAGLAALVGVAAATLPAQSAASAAPALAPYLRRGAEVEARYAAYRLRLENFFAALSARLDVEQRKQLEPPAPALAGYQLLPGLLPGPARKIGPSRIRTSPFSWSRTEGFIERDGKVLDAMEARLRAAPAPSREPLEPGLAAWQQLREGQKLIESTIQYNKLWQGEIARHPDFYREQNALEDAVTERQALLDASTLRPKQRARLEVLSQQVERAVHKFPTPGYLRIEHPSARRFILRVPVYTDILDAAFVEKARASIEEPWQLHEGGDDYSVALELHLVSPAALYPQGAPAHGAQLDLADHLARFPPNGVVLTTGATTIYASGRGILLGPHAIPRSALAHEFGHMLGFRDGYLRGFHDRGVDGYEVVEVILVDGDVVGAPEEGRVRRQHFEQVFGERR